MAPPPAEGPVRRGDHRRRRARSGHRLLPGEARHHATSRCWTRATSAAARSGRNTAIIRSNYRTPEGIPFYTRASSCTRACRGSWTTTCCSRSRATSRWRHTELGVNGPARARRDQQAARRRQPDHRPRRRSRSWCPDLESADRPRYPILGALYHPPGGIIRHDAVVWGYARGADRARRADPPVHRGDRHRRRRRPGRRRGDRPRARSGPAPCVNATAGWCSTDRAAWSASTCRSRRTRCRRCVTERLKPFLDKVIVSATAARLHQPDRPRRGGDRRGDRPLHLATACAPRCAFLENAAAPHAGAVPVPARRQASCASGRASAT